MTVLRGALSQYVMTRPPLRELPADRVQAFNQLDQIVVAGVMPVIDTESDEHVLGASCPARGRLIQERAPVLREDREAVGYLHEAVEYRRAWLRL